MTLKAALAEAYASGDTEGVPVETLEANHASLAAPIRLARNVDSALGQPGDTVLLPLVEGGEKVPHLLCAFGFVRPGTDDDGPTEGRIQIDNVSDLLHDLMMNLVGYDAPIILTFRIYRVLPSTGLAAVTGPDDDTFSGLELHEVQVGADQAEGAVKWPDGRQINVPTGPNAFFDRDAYPGLFS